MTEPITEIQIQSGSPEGLDGSAASKVADPSDTATGDTAPDSQPGDEVDNPVAAAKGRENSKLRERLRDTTAKLETMQRREVERIASQHLADGADFWRDGAEITDLLDEDGNIDAAKVDATAKALLESHRHWRKGVPAAPPASTVTSDGKIGGAPRGNSFEDAFRPRSG